MTQSRAIIDGVVEATDEADDPPTAVFQDGTKEWRDQWRLLHRVGGPAVVLPNGGTNWYHHGKLHRLDGPALDYRDGRKIWYRYGVLHRTDGPASIMPGWVSAYFVDGRQFTEEEFYRYVDQDTGEVLVPPGKKLRHDYR